MKKRNLIITALILFSVSVYLALLSGKIILTESSSAQAVIQPIVTPLIYTGFKGKVAQSFALAFGSLMKIFGHSVLASIIALALLVELILLYPAIRVQLKQKKIHLLHKKLIDRFNRGELAVSATEQELHRLYSVNESIHHRGSWLVAAQLALLFFSFWGLNLIAKSPQLIQSSWSMTNFILLTKANGVWIPLLASLIYFFHALVKMYYKQREDYISGAQITLAFAFAVLGSIAVYYFATLFAVALVIYFATLVTFATIRYLIVEQHSREWGKMVQGELVQNLREAQPHQNRFQYLSRLWNHLPVVRHVNFNLLEEALSMTLGLLLVLTFFGAFGITNGELSGAQLQAAMLQLEIESWLQ